MFQPPPDCIAYLSANKSTYALVGHVDRGMQCEIKDNVTNETWASAFGDTELNALVNAVMVARNGTRPVTSPLGVDAEVAKLRSELAGVLEQLANKTLTENKEKRSFRSKKPPSDDFNADAPKGDD